MCLIQEEEALQESQALRFVSTSKIVSRLDQLGKLVSKKSIYWFLQPRSCLPTRLHHFVCSFFLSSFLASGRLSSFPVPGKGKLRTWHLRERKWMKYSTWKRRKIGEYNNLAKFSYPLRQSVWASLLSPPKAGLHFDHFLISAISADRGPADTIHLPVFVVVEFSL